MSSAQDLISLTTIITCWDSAPAIKQPISAITTPPTAFKDDFITGTSLINASTGFACGYDGGIYKTEDAGKSWQTVLKPNTLLKKRIHFNAIHFKNTKGWAVGNNGLIMTSPNGIRWETSYTNLSSDFLSVNENPDGDMVVTTSSGEILVIRP